MDKKHNIAGSPGHNNNSSNRISSPITDLSVSPQEIKSKRAAKDMIRPEITPKKAKLSHKINFEGTDKNGKIVKNHKANLQDRPSLKRPTISPVFKKLKQKHNIQPLNIDLPALLHDKIGGDSFKRFYRSVNAPDSVFRFMDLPLEIRESVYSYVLRKEDIIRPFLNAGSPRIPTPKDQITSLLKVSKQVREEALPYFYGNKEIQLGGVRGVRRWISNLTLEAKENIYEVAFTWNKIKHCQEAFQKLSRCQHIKIIKISFRRGVAAVLGLPMKPGYESTALNIMSQALGQISGLGRIDLLYFPEAKPVATEAAKRLGMNVRMDKAAVVSMCEV
ncbi:MAG: hypothetical protein M1834_006655 [Cirrosporium novae-zelandiae]|nr:MAG: hypothetical protein M1834_006655 [Cirrosporium novae-zelandiae]